MMTTEGTRLRQRAQWYRDFAKLGTRQESEWRGQMAEYFERLAEQSERTAESDTPKKAN